MNKNIYIPLLLLSMVGSYGYVSYQKLQVADTKACLSMIYNAQKNYKQINHTYADSIKKLALQFPSYCKGLQLTVKSDQFQYSVLAKNSSSDIWEANHRKQIIKKF
jgi:hypothetical protein